MSQRKKGESSIPRPKKCIFVGYGNETKGYRLFDTVRQKIIFSRDVVFNEQEYCSGSQFPEEDTSHRVELELSSDEPPVELQDIQPVESAREERMSLQVVRRSSRLKHRPDYYGYETTLFRVRATWLKTM